MMLPRNTKFPPLPKWLGVGALAVGGAVLSWVLVKRLKGKKVLVVGDGPKKAPAPAPAPKADDPALP